MAFLGDDKSLVYELILALVSLWLLVDLIKKEKSQRETFDCFFLVYFTKRYFLIIILLFYLFLVSNVVTAWPNGRISF